MSERALGYGFPKTDRVTRRVDFLTAQKRGRRVHSQHFVLVLFDRGVEGPARLGLVTSRKVANAVGRNRIRRVLREVFRLNRESFPARFDVVVIAREGAAGLDSHAIRAEILAALARRKGGPAAARSTAPEAPVKPPVKP